MIDQLVKMGLPLPKDILKTIVKVQNMLNIFKLTLRLEIGYVLGDGTVATAAADTKTIFNVAGNKIKTYGWGDMDAISKTGC